MMHRTNSSKFFAALAFFILFGLLMSPASFAQTKAKPKLVPIIQNTEYFNETTSDKEAAKIAEKLYQQYLKSNNLEKFYKYSDIFAKIIPIGQQNSKSIFIVSQVMEPPIGCYAKGCATFIYHSKNGKSWSTVYSGHVKSLWYDINSRQDSPANLIASSNEKNAKPGIWTWNNEKYFLANRK